MWNRLVRALVLVRLRLRALVQGSNRFLVNLFRRCAGRRHRGRFRRQFLGHRAADMGLIADDLRVVRAAAGPAEIAAGVLAGAAVVAADAAAAVAEPDLAGIAADDSGASFPHRSMHRHDRLRIMRANRERRKDISQLCCLENLSRNSGREGRRIFRQRLRRRSRMMPKRRRVIRLLSSSMNPACMNRARMNQDRMGTCRKMWVKKRTRECMIR